MYGLHGSIRSTLLLTNDGVEIALWIYVLYLLFYRKPDHKKPWAEMTNDELLWLYVHFTKTWGEALRRDAVSKAKESDGTPSSPIEVSKLVRDLKNNAWGAYLEIKKRDPELKILRQLLKNKNDGVKILTARHLIWVDEKEAVATLIKAGQGNDILAKTAQGLMAAWRSGKINQTKIYPPQHYIAVILFEHRPTLSEAIVSDTVG